ncbi:MAG TPA: type II toxin-antitoxin system VapB family antitoxin [Terracidiphilus sp.]|nr:type II toxin-antitoxin system VapB family antitoxin [Terracidiphilus sp.]
MVAARRKAKVFMTGRSQAVRIPAEFRFNASEVYVRKDEQTGDLILSQVPSSWDEIFAEIDKAGFPPEFMEDRDQGVAEKREEL